MVAIEAESGTVTDWRRNAPVLDHVEWNDVYFAHRTRWQSEDGLTRAEQADYQVLVEGGEGPICLQRERGERHEFVFLLDLEQSTLPYRVGFPVLLANLSRIARRAVGLEERFARSTRGVFELPAVGPRERITVETPRGERFERRADARGRLGAISVEHVGRYRVHGERDQSYGVSLLHPGESSLSVVEEVLFPEATVVASTARARTERNLWPTLAVLALGVLLIEWWCFQRPGLRRRLRVASSGVRA